MSVPPAISDSTSPDANSWTPSPSPRFQVLVVEDDEAIARLLTLTLTRAGYDVAVEGTGERAVTFPDGNRRRPDLVISDVCLPGISGVDVARQLRARLPGLPIILTSGYPFGAFGSTREVPVEFAFLPKPFDPRALIALVGSLLETGGVPSPPPTPVRGTSSRSVRSTY